MINEPGYRLNVGLVVINDKGKLLLCKRKNINNSNFQGGIDFDPLSYRRELWEVGIKRGCNLISSTDEWFKYDAS